MSYIEARSHFENARNNTMDKTLIDLLDGLKHLSHAIEEDVRALRQSICDFQDTQKRQIAEDSFKPPKIP